MKSEPQKEHQWLKRLLGEWTSETEAAMKPGDAPSTMKGSETVRSLGDLWIIGESEGEVPGGGTAHMRLTLGYDPRKQRFVGTWIGSMMAYMWVYNGSLDAGGNVLTLDTEGPSMAGDGSMQRYQDIIEFHSADYRTLSAQALGADGKWTRFMTAHYRRK
jgi:hypothetical protein